MKNFLAPVMQNKVVNKVTSEVSKFYLNHESAFLTGGTIGFSLATTGITLKNAGEINRILDIAKSHLVYCETKEEKNEVYAETLRQLAPLVAPIILFQALTIGCALYSKKQSDKKLAAAAGALSIAQEAISRYQTFQKDTEKALGDEKYAQLQNDIYSGQEIDGRRFTHVASEGAPGEVLMIDKYSGRPFWCTCDRVDGAAREISRMLDCGRADVVTIDDWYGFIGNVDLTSQESVLATKFGYVPDGYDHNNIAARFADTHYRFPNGTVIPAFEAYLYPEPACIDWEL